MRYLILVLMAAGILCGQEFPGAHPVSAVEFARLFAAAKRDIADQVPWAKYDTWFMHLIGPPLSQNESNGPFFERALADWSSASHKTFLTPTGAAIDADHPSMTIEIQRLLPDVAIVDVEHGLPLAGGSFRLVYRQREDAWILMNKISGGIR